MQNRVAHYEGPTPRRQGLPLAPEAHFSLDLLTIFHIINPEPLDLLTIFHIINPEPLGRLIGRTRIPVTALRKREARFY